MKISQLDASTDSIIGASELIYAAEREVFTMMFGCDEKKAVEIISECIRMKKAPYNPANIYVATISEKIVGILNAYTGKNDNFPNKSYFSLARMFPAWNLPRAYIAQIIINQTTVGKVGIDELFIADIAVSKDMRGKGIGSDLLKYCTFLAKEKECFREILEVNVHKRDVALMYENKGFKKYAKRTLPLLGGYYLMEREE